MFLLRFVFVSLLFLTCQNNAGNSTPSFTEEGGASYYHDKFQGKPTASGQPYDKNKFTAAHRTLPFGTKVQVCLLNEVSDTVEVVVNDRGPFSKGRIIDLSRAAAQKLGLVRRGVADVKIMVFDEQP